MGKNSITSPGNDLYPKPHSLTASFGYALAGLASAIKTERNLRIHLVAMTLALIIGIALHLSVIEWCLIVILCGLVISAELFNTAIEKSLNVVTRQYNAEVKRIKDIAAGAVFVMAIAAAAIGLIIFISAALRLV